MNQPFDRCANLQLQVNNTSKFKAKQFELLKKLVFTILKNRGYLATSLTLAE